MKVCMRCGLLYWDQQQFCVVCEKKLAPYKEKPISKMPPDLEQAMNKYLREKKQN